MTNDKRTIIQKKADAFCVLKEKVHITYNTGHWARGIILEVGSEFFILDETLEGRIPIFFQEIKNIVKYVPKKEGVDDGEF